MTATLKEASLLPNIKVSLLKPEEWAISPGGHTRDSDLLEESNHVGILKEMFEVDPNGLDHQLLRFGHWAVGWVEVIVVRKGSLAWQTACDIAVDLDSYPVFDENLYAEIKDNGGEDE